MVHTQALRNKKRSEKLIIPYIVAKKLIIFSEDQLCYRVFGTQNPPTTIMFFAFISSSVPTERNKFGDTHQYEHDSDIIYSYLTCLHKYFSKMYY